MCLSPTEKYFGIGKEPALHSFVNGSTLQTYLYLLILWYSDGAHLKKKKPAMYYTENQDKDFGNKLKGTTAAAKQDIVTSDALASELHSSEKYG